MGQSSMVLASSLATTAILFALLYSAARASRSKLFPMVDQSTGAEVRKSQPRARDPVVLKIASFEARLYRLGCEVEIALPQRIRKIDQRIHEADREIARLCRQISPETHSSVGAAHRVPDVLTADAQLLPIGTMVPGRRRAAVIDPSERRKIRRAA